MSFGWSASDIVAALQLLNKAIIALKDTGGASSDYQDVSSFLNILSVTLEHLKALQAAPLDPNLAANLGQLCEQVQEPVSSFCDYIRSSFERDLGVDSTRLRFLTTGRKLQWALSTSKKAKALREKISGPVAAIGIVLGQQVVQNFLQMPSEIQARIAHTIDTAIDTRISPSNTIDLQTKFDALSITSKNCLEGIAKIEDTALQTLDSVQNYAANDRAASVSAQKIISDLSTRQSQSTNIIFRRILRTSQETTRAIQMHSSVSQDQTSSLHQKLDRMDWLIGRVNDRIGDLSTAQRFATLNTSKFEIQSAIGNIQRGLWLLVSALHVLLRELIYLLVPHLVALYRSSIQPFLPCGDHFLFEDVIGRRKWLPCLQFQHWDNFYNLLINTFQGELGLSHVLNGQFMILNGFNEVPIHKRAWSAGIQPRSRVNMAITVDAATVTKGRCPDPSCLGQVDFGKDQVTRVCPICGKHVSALNDFTTENEDYGTETTFSFNFESDIRIPTLKGKDIQDGQLSSVESAPPKPRFRLVVVDKEIAAFKRIIWQDSNKTEAPEPLQANTLEKSSLPAGKRPTRRSRVIQARQNPSSRVQKFDHSASNQRGTFAIVQEDQSKLIKEIPTDTSSDQSGGNHVLQDYQMQLMLLEQTNKARLMKARQELDSGIFEPFDTSSDLSVKFRVLEAQQKEIELMILGLMSERQEQDSSSSKPIPPKTRIILPKPHRREVNASHLAVPMPEPRVPGNIF